MNRYKPFEIGLVLFDGSVVSAKREKIVNNWKDAKKYPFISLKNKELLHYIRALELNSDFIEEITRIRKKYNIPIEGCIGEENYNNSKIIEEVVKQHSGEFHRKTIRDIRNLSYYMDDFLFSEWDFVNEEFLVGNYIMPIYDEFCIYVNQMPEDSHPSGPFLLIELGSEMISQKMLFEGIKAKWPVIEEKLQKNKKPFAITSRDLRIVELKDFGDKNYDQIVEILEEEFNIDNYEGELNYDSVKNAYSKAKRKISQVFNLKHPDAKKRKFRQSMYMRKLNKRFGPK